MEGINAVDLQSELREVKLPEFPNMSFTFSLAGLLFLEPLQSFFGGDNISDVSESRRTD